MQPVWMRVTATAILVAHLTSPVRAGPVTADLVPVAVLAGIDEVTMARRLEKPASCERIQEGRKCVYLGGAVEIVFIGGLADWFTIYPANEVYGIAGLSQLGLGSDQKPTHKNKHGTDWANVNGLLKISAFPGAAGKVSYFYVKARTP